MCLSERWANTYYETFCLTMEIWSYDEYGFTCSTHEASLCTKAKRVMVNAFLNNQRKCSTDRIVPLTISNVNSSNVINVALHSLFCYDERKLEYSSYFKFCTHLSEMFVPSYFNVPHGQLLGP